MKKLLQLICVALCTSILLSSCSRLKDFSITKRHYRSGYTVDFGSPKKDAKNLQGDSNPAVAVQISPTNSKAGTNQSIASNETNNNVAPKKELYDSAPTYITLREKNKDNDAGTSGNVYASQDNSIVAEEIKSDESDKQITSLNAITDSSSSSSETPMWLLIVLCILLPPLAVGLKFGFVDKFWISCLLTLLFWIPGVVYALIVVTRE